MEVNGSKPKRTNKGAAPATPKQTSGGKPNRATYAKVYADFGDAYRQACGKPYRPTPQDKREITAAIKLGTLDGIPDRVELFAATLRWLGTKNLAQTAKATVNNLANGEAAMHASADTASPPGGVTDIDAFRRELTLADEPAPPQNTAGEKEGTP